MYAIIKFNLATEMAKEINFENGDFRKFEGSVSLTLDDLESSHIVSLTSIHLTIVHMSPLSLMVNGRTDRHLSTNVDRQT